MIHPLRMHYDKLLLAIAIAALGWTLDWVRRQQTVSRLVRAEAANLRPPAAAYVPESRKPAAVTMSSWSKPRTQSQGEGWLYEVFTPPVIHYNAADRAFALTPTGPVIESSDAKSSAWELLAVKPDAFRLQLAGYFGTPGDYLVAFLSPKSADTHLVREGHRFAGLELIFRSFEVRNVLVEENESGPVHEVAALAVLFDERSNREVILDSRLWRFADSPVAVLRQPNSEAGPRELREGDAFAEGDVLCRIERIQLDPAEAVVSRATPGLPVPELRALRPAAPSVNTTSTSELMPRIGAGRVAVSSQ